MRHPPRDERPWGASIGLAALPPATANRLVSAWLCGGRSENGCGEVVVAMHTRVGTAAQLVAVAASELFPDLPRSDAIGCSGHTHR
jgi:hypothetical protein